MAGSNDAPGPPQLNAGGNARVQVILSDRPGGPRLVDARGRPRPGGAAAPSLLPQSNQTNIAQSAAGRLLTFSAPNAPIAPVYGHTTVGGTVFYWERTGNALAIMVAIGEGGPAGIESIENIWIDGRPIGGAVDATPIAGLALVNNTNYFKYLGTKTQAVNSTIYAVNGSHVSGFPGLAYVAAVLPFPTAEMGSYDPARWRFEVKGIKVRDPRVDLTTYAYSENPVLHLYDLCTNPTYGAGIPDSYMDSGVTGSWANAANDCDADIGGGVKRYVMGLMVRDAAAISQWVETIRAHFMGYMAFNSGKLQIFIDKQKSASGITFTDSGTGANVIGLPSLKSKGLAQIPTRVVVSFTDSTLDYIDATAQAELPTVSTRDDEVRELRLNLPGVLTFQQAQRLAIQYLNRGLLDKTLEWYTTPEGLQPLPGDVVEVTSALGLTAQEILVTDTEPDNSGLRWKHRGELYDPDAYSDDIESNSNPTPPIPPSPFGGVLDPVGASVTEYFTLDSTNRQIEKLKVDWTNPGDPFYAGVRITVDDSTNVVTMADQHDGPVYIENPKVGASYTITLKTVNTAGLLSPGVVLNITPIGAHVVRTKYVYGNSINLSYSYDTFGHARGGTPGGFYTRSTGGLGPLRVRRFTDAITFASGEQDVIQRGWIDFNTVGVLPDDAEIVGGSIEAWGNYPQSAVVHASSTTTTAATWGADTDAGLFARISFGDYGSQDLSILPTVGGSGAYKPISTLTASGYGIISNIAHTVYAMSLHPDYENVSPVLDSDTITSTLNDQLAYPGPRLKILYTSDTETSGTGGDGTGIDLQASYPGTTQTGHGHISGTFGAGYFKGSLPLEWVGVVSGTINGANDTFTIPSTPTSGGMLIRNRSIMIPGGVDYTRTGTTIVYTADNIPTPNDDHFFIYNS